MEFVASIFTAIDFGFKTSKLLHSIISGVKDVPDNLQQTATAIDDLLSVLEQLSKCRALDKSGSEALRDRLLKCVDDLEAFDGRPKGLKIEEAEKRCERYWKRFKAVYNEKALDKMRAIVVGHTAALNLHLATLQSETVFGISDQLATIDRRLVSQKTVSQIPGQLHTITQELVQQRTERQSQTTMWEEHRMTLGQVSHDVSSLQQGIDSAKKQVLASQTAQAAETNQKLDQILEQMLKLTLERQQPSRMVEAPEHESATPEPSGLGPCSGLMNSIARLCHLVNLHQKKRTLSNSTDVVKSLLALLCYMMSGEFLQGAVAASLVSKGTCDRCCGPHVESLQAALSSVYGVLLSSRRTTLNHHGKEKRVRSVTLTRTDSSATAYHLGIGTLIVCSGTRYTCESAGHADSPHQLIPSQSEEVTTRISFIPSQQQPLQQMIRLTTRQSVKEDGVFSSIPILEVNRVLPAGSPVFSIVREGRFEDFMALLRDGKASVRDHDEYGASLLHYSNEQPQMCRYLVESGLDVNSLGKDTALTPSWMESEPEMASPLYNFTDDHLAEDEQLHRMVLCRKYLLEAGADLTWSVLINDPTWRIDNIIGRTFKGAVPEAMKLALDQFGYETCQTELHKSPLVFICRVGNFNLEAINLLLQRGATVYDRDPFGNTCLHECLGQPAIGIYKYNSSGMRDSVVYLIQQGADVFAENNSGETVSDAAYTTNKGYTIFENKFREELWDCVLATCGYNISDFRRRRRPAINSRPCRFTKGHFEDLWAGFEHLRPDYENEKSTIYLTDSDEAGEYDGNSEFGQLDEEIWSDSEDECGGISELEEVGRSDGSESEDGGVRLAPRRGRHSRRCCSAYVRIHSS